MKIREARFSRNVEKANIVVHEAEAGLLRALERSYPLGEAVRVIHYRGEYTGIVVGHDRYGVRVIIKNEESGKISRRYFREVETEYGHT